jgi:hypothetical protein
MSARTKLTHAELNRVLEEIDNYEQTVNALLAFISVVAWDSQNKCLRPDYPFAIGRRMAPKGKKAKREVTPDVVIQLNKDYGIVAEAKQSLPQDNTYWRSTLDQLKSYDGHLIGWWTDAHETIAQSDVALLIHQTLGPKFDKYLAEVEKREGPQFSSPLARIEYNPLPQVNECIYLCLRSGQLRKQPLSAALTDGVPVPLEDMRATHKNQKFYDSEPPPELLLVTIWNEYIKPLKEKSPRDPKLGCRRILVSAKKITQELQKAYGSASRGSRDAEYPHQSWVTNALKILVKLKLAKRKDADQFEILYRDIRGDLVEFFARHRIPKTRRPRIGRKQSRDTQTLSLFKDSM